MKGGDISNLITWITPIDEYTQEERDNIINTANEKLAKYLLGDTNRNDYMNGTSQYLTLLDDFNMTGSITIKDRMLLHRPKRKMRQKRSYDLYIL